MTFQCTNYFLYEFFFFKRPVEDWCWLFTKTQKICSTTCWSETIMKPNINLWTCQNRADRSTCHVPRCLTNLLLADCSKGVLSSRIIDWRINLQYSGAPKKSSPSHLQPNIKPNHWSIWSSALISGIIQPKHYNPRTGTWRNVCIWSRVGILRHYNSDR